MDLDDGASQRVKTNLKEQALCSKHLESQDFADGLDTIDRASEMRWVRIVDKTKTPKVKLRICKRCQKPFYRAQMLGSETVRYCSKACAVNRSTMRVRQPCTVCGEPAHGHGYCKRHYYEHHTKPMKAAKAEAAKLARMNGTVASHV